MNAHVHKPGLLMVLVRVGLGPCFALRPYCLPFPPSSTLLGSARPRVYYSMCKQTCPFFAFVVRLHLQLREHWFSSFSLSSKWPVDPRGQLLRGLRRGSCHHPYSLQIVDARSQKCRRALVFEPCDSSGSRNVSCHHKISVVHVSSSCRSQGGPS